MAWALKDQLNFSGTGANTSVHLNNCVNGYASLVAIAVAQGSTGRIGSVTDSKSNTYTKFNSYAGTGCEIELWYCLNATMDNTTTVTVTPTVGTDVWTANWWVGSGLDGYQAADKSVGASGTGTTGDSGNAPTTTQLSEVIFGVVAQANNRPISAGTGYTNITSGSNGASITIESEYKSVSAAGAYNSTSTWDLSSNWVQATFTFILAPAYVQSILSTAMTSPSSTATLPSNVVVGNTILVLIGWSYLGCPPSITDGLGNTYTSQGTQPTPTAGSIFYVFTAPVTTGGACTLTLTAACGNAAGGFAAVEVSGLKADPFDQQNVNETTATPSTSGSMTTTQNNEYVGAIFFEQTNRGFTATPNFIIENSIADLAYVDFVQGQAGAVNPSVASSATAPFPVWGYGASFKPIFTAAVTSGLEWMQPRSQPTNHYRPDIVST